MCLIIITIIIVIFIIVIIIITGIIVIISVTWSWPPQWSPSPPSAPARCDPPPHLGSRHRKDSVNLWKKPFKVFLINVHLVVVIIELCQGLVDGQLHNTWVHSFKNIKTFGPAPNITTILPWKSGLAEQSLESPKLIWHPRSNVYNPANH